jgi:hypothetical protein
MVIGSRLHVGSRSEFKTLNRAGNRVLLAFANAFFKVKLTDLLSGYSVFSREFVRRLPLSSGGFEIETELTVNALDRGFRLLEIPTNLSSRPTGSYSKIKVVHDGITIFRLIFALFRDYKPLAFFASVGLFLIVAGLVPGAIAILEFIEIRFIHHVPSAILTVGLVLAGMLTIFAGLILHTIVRRFQELEYQLRDANGSVLLGVPGRDYEYPGLRPRALPVNSSFDPAAHDREDISPGPSLPGLR